MKIGVELLLFPWVLGLLMAQQMTPVEADTGATERFKSSSVQDTSQKNEYDPSRPFIRGGNAGQSPLLEAIRNLKKHEPKQESQDDDSEDDDEDSDEDDNSEETETIVSTSKVVDQEAYVPETVTSSNTNDGTWKTQGPLCVVGAVAVALLVSLVASRRRRNQPQKQTEDDSSPENIIRYVLDPELLDDITVATSSTNLSRQALCSGS